MTNEKKEFYGEEILKGGPGSGHHGHSGLSGVWGGSRPSGADKGGGGQGGPKKSPKEEYTPHHNEIIEAFEDSLKGGDYTVHEQDSPGPDMKYEVVLDMPSHIVQYLESQKGALEGWLEQYAGDAVSYYLEDDYNFDFDMVSNIFADTETLSVNSAKTKVSVKVNVYMADDHNKEFYPEGTEEKKQMYGDSVLGE